MNWQIDGFVHPPGLTRDREGAMLRGASEQGLPVSVTMAQRGYPLAQQGMVAPDPVDLPDAETPDFGDPMNYFLIRQNVVDMVGYGRGSGFWV